MNVAARWAAGWGVASLRLETILRCKERVEPRAKPSGRAARRAAPVWLTLVAAVGLSGCTTASYYWQSASGHLSLLQAARPVADWLQDDATPAPLRERLALAQRIRAFASSALHLPDNASYRRYADLKRRAAVWSVTAAPPDSLTLKTWCYPVIGCAGYRGYYDERAANALAAQLAAADGLETSVLAVPAYSTLGWLNWLGGDPRLSTFIHYPEGELARMVFHELAHQVVYVADDTAFNESFATAVERLGVTEWLAREAGEAARRDYAAFDARRQAFRVLTADTRRELDAIYKQKRAQVGEQSAWLATKSEAMARFRQRYEALKAQWAAEGRPFSGYDGWVARANNASFGVQAAYNELVPGFEALFAQQGGDWPRFHAAVRELSTLPLAERQARRRAMAAASKPDTTSAGAAR